MKIERIFHKLKLVEQDIIGPQFLLCQMADIVYLITNLQLLILILKKILVHLDIIDLLLEQHVMQITLRLHDLDHFQLRQAVVLRGTVGYLNQQIQEVVIVRQGQLLMEDFQVLFIL